MQESADTFSLPGEREQLRFALLADQGGMLSATRRRLTRIAQARGVPPHAVDDIVQETLLEAWRHMDRLYAPSGFHFWVDEICRNVCRRAARTRERDMHRNISLPLLATATDDANDIGGMDAFAAETPDPLDELSRQDLALLLDRALGLLPADSRQVIELCDLLELPRAEVAGRLGLSSNALDVRLHRARRSLRQLLHGPLRGDAEALGVALDADLIEGWRSTRIWCPVCARHRLEGLFIERGPDEGPNLHVRCPDCSRRYGQDTMHSMGLVDLAGLRSFRPAWKRAMQGLTDRMMQALPRGEHTCPCCGSVASVQVKGGDMEGAGPYPFWIETRCPQCGDEVYARGDFPSVDQMVFWSHPRTRQFLQRHTRWSAEPGQLTEYENAPAILFQLADRESGNRMTVLAHRETLRVLAIS